MKFSVVASTIALACLVFGAAQAKIETEDEVLVLTKDNFDEALKEHDYILIEFCEYLRIWMCIVCAMWERGSGD